ncbi:MAG: NAD-dependent malic enzyme [Candidatus Riflebacteria bacterium]|nr:NAD-dependent malic enzyme [Candidatus Riflebacteria bacterium]
MDFCLKFDPATGQQYIASSKKGQAILRDPFTNKGSGFTARERVELELDGLLPPLVNNMKQQLERVYENYSNRANNIDKYIFLTGLQDRNETLFFRLVLDHIDEMMPIVYTPVVGEACQTFSHIYRRPRGLYIGFDQKKHIERILRHSPSKTPSIIVVTDGERILGLGDQGAGGMGIPIGKLNLYTICAGVSPFTTLPIMLDVGTNNEDRLKDPLYLGLRMKRVHGDEYQGFIDEFVAAVQKVFPKAVLQWEDFLKGNAIKQLNRFRDKLCTFNDDIQGTASVTVAGIFSGLRISGQAMRDQKVVFAGAGASAQGISDLIVAAMMEEGLTREEANARIWTVDSKGLVTKDRPELEEFKATYARSVEEVASYKCRNKSNITLEEVVVNAKPTILLGSSGSPGTFTENVVKAMARINKHSLIFPLSNPTSKAECTPEDAIRWSEGTAIVATGSPFAPVTYNGRKFRIGQSNNAYIFPGIGLAATVAHIRRLTIGMFLDAARALANQLTQEDLNEGALFPPLPRIRECSHAVACAVIKRAVKDGFADDDILENLNSSVTRAMWFPEYLPIRYEPK